MKIPGSPQRTTAPMTLQGPASHGPAGVQAGAGANGSVAGTSMPFAGAGPVNGANMSQSPSERLERYAAHIEARLDNLQENEPGLDLSQVRADFRDHIGRLQDAMAQGGLSGSDLAQGIQNSVDMVRDGVRAALDLPQIVSTGTTQGVDAGQQTAGDPSANIDLDHAMDRLQAMQDRINERMALYMANTPESERGAVHEASDRMAHNFDRLRNALQTGSMSYEDIRRSMENIMGGLADDLNVTTTSSMVVGDGPETGTLPANPADGAAATEVSVPVASASAPEVNARQAVSLTSEAIESLLTKGGSNQSLSLLDYLSERPQVRSFLQDVQAGAREALATGASTYGPAAQLLSAQALPGAMGLDVAI